MFWSHFLIVQVAGTIFFEHDIDIAPLELDGYKKVSFQNGVTQQNVIA